jgi:hypothetical protein
MNKASKLLTEPIIDALGIDPHSCGFMNKAFVELVIFVASRMIILCLGFFPLCAALGGL